MLKSFGLSVSQRVASLQLLFNQTIFGMGMSSSKVASNVVSRSFQAVKPHIPSIKFRKSQSSAVSPFKSSNSSGTTPPPPPTTTTTNTTTTTTTIEYDELPINYRRKPISAEEMEYIEKGGKV